MPTKETEVATLIGQLSSILTRLQGEPASPFNTEIEVALSDARNMILDQEKQIGAYDLVATDLVELGVQHVYHHSDSDGARINVKVEKNTKGFNYEATVTGAKSVDEAIGLLKDAENKLQAAYTQVVSSAPQA